MLHKSLFFEENKIASDDPLFAERAFLFVAKELKKREDTDEYKKILCEEYGYLSKRVELSRFQESCSVRNVLKVRNLSKILISNEGELNLPLLNTIISLLENHTYSLGPNRQYDAPRNEHLLNALKKLRDNLAIQRQLKMISKPTSHRVIEEVIRETLLLEPHEVITDAHARQATLAAWLTFLRQSVGSCFATAPAILVHNEQPEIFFKDLNELFSTGRIKRVVAGHEYSSPFSISWGAGDLRKPILIDPREPGALENLAFSPGILLGLERAGFLSAKKNQKQKIEEAQRLALKALHNLLKGVEKEILIQAETILRQIFLSHFNLTSAEIEEYQNRPKEMLPIGLLVMQPRLFSKSEKKNEVIQKYLQQFEIAKAGFKSLSDNALLKSWEFTLASFAETKPGFTRWNMYAGLGFNPEDAGGIGEFLYRKIKDKLDQVNAKVMEYNHEYELVYSQLRYIEARFQNVSSEKELQWTRMEYQAKKNEFLTLEEMRDREQFKAKKFANLYNEILETYDKLFPEYFQEVYDADMHEVSTGPYDDSPAGFRLLFKHGRTNTSQWTLIYSPQEFTESLISFFTATEIQIVTDPQFEGLQEEITDLITALVNHVRTEEFIESALNRMAVAYGGKPIKNPLQHLDKVDKKPWAYTSGGTMSNLLSCYFRFDGKPKEEERWVENEMELFVFLTDTIKQMPFGVSEEYLEDRFKSLLMHSPTHAFNLKPAFPLFKEAILSESFSYTWIRDQLVRPAEHFIDFLFLDEEMSQFLLGKLMELVPLNFKPRFKSHFKEFVGKKSAVEFRQFLIQELDRDRGMQIAGQNVLSNDEIDSCLYALLPLTPKLELRTRLERIFEDLPDLEDQEIGAHINEVAARWGNTPFVTAQQLQALALVVINLTLNLSTTKHDYPLLISQIAQKKGYALPTPIFFADTNWVKDLFAFLVSPGTGKLELWRSDYTGLEGAPMSQWSPWLDGSRKDQKWGIYSKPHEYKLI